MYADEGITLIRNSEHQCNHRNLWSICGSDKGGAKVNDEEYKHSDITHKIIGAAMKVHSTLGSGFQEVIYQRALAIEMPKQGLSFQRELEMQIYYDGIEIGTRRVDFLVEDKVMVEIKALTQLESVHLAQVINYLEAYQLEIGLLLNFGAKSLEYRRLIKSLTADVR
jgi:GxxExxY protein